MAKIFKIKHRGTPTTLASGHAEINSSVNTMPGTVPSIRFSLIVEAAATNEKAYGLHLESEELMRLCLQVRLGYATMRVTSEEMKTWMHLTRKILE